MSSHDRPSLSTRERQMLKLAADGLTDTAIAHLLGISKATVSTYWGRIRTKIGLHSRTELVATMMRGEMKRTVTAIREEHRQQDHEVASQVDFYKQMLDQAPDAILIVQRDGRIQLVNQAAADMFGWRIEELSGRNISDLVPARLREIHAHQMSHFFDHPVKGAMRDHVATPGLHRTGKEIPIDASLSAVGEGDGRWVICIVRNMDRRLFGDLDVP